MIPILILMIFGEYNNPYADFPTDSIYHHNLNTNKTYIGESYQPEFLCRRLTFFTFFTQIPFWFDEFFCLHETLQTV